MHLRLTTALVLVALCGPVFAADPPKALVKKEAAARTRVGDEILKLARLSSRNKAYSDARAVLKKGLVVCPGHKKLTLELSRVPDREDAPKKGYAEKFRTQRETAYRKCAEHLGKVALLYDEEDLSEHFERLVAIVLTHFPSDENLKRFDLAWFDPYRKWVRQTDAKQLADGWERIDGEWAKPEAVAALNEKHATWASPWVLSDEVHELKTTLPLRKARQIMGHVTSFRRFFLAEFAGEWDLVPPDGKLPVIVTATQKELMAQLTKASGGQIPSGLPGAAYYMWTNMPLNPCFATLEPNVANAGTIKVGLDELFSSLQHEITHQLASEYSKHDANLTKYMEHQFWCVEAIANFMNYYVLDRNGWRLTHPKTMPLGTGLQRGAFAYCKTNLASLPRLEGFFAIKKEVFVNTRNYMMAATVAYFMLHGEKGRYRAPFVKLLETVHKVHDSKTSLDECFAGVDREKMQKDWEAFVRGIELDS